MASVGVTIEPMDAAVGLAYAVCAQTAMDVDRATMAAQVLEAIEGGNMKQAETFVYTAIAVYCPSVSDTPVLKRLT